MPTSMQNEGDVGIGDHPQKPRSVHPGSSRFDASGSLVASCRVSPPASSTVRPSICSKQFGRVARDEIDDIRSAMRRWRKDWRPRAPLSRPNRRCARAARQGCGSSATASFVAFAVMASFVFRLLVAAVLLFLIALVRGSVPADPAAGRQSAPASRLRDWCPAPWPRYAWRRGYRCPRWPHGLRRGNVADDGNSATPSTSAIISRMLVERPPGVFRRRTTTSACRSLALVSASFT